MTYDCEFKDISFKTLNTITNHCTDGILTITVTEKTCAVCNKTRWIRSKDFNPNGFPLGWVEDEEIDDPCIGESESE